MRGWPSIITRITEVRPAIAPSLIEPAEPRRARMRSSATATGAGVLSCGYGTMPVSTADISDVEDVQMTSAAEDADRHVALRILRFLRGGRHRVEADVGEEDDAAPRSMPLQPNSPNSPVFGGMNGMPVRGVDVRRRRSR